jgi:glucose-6-phosphate isomerase
VLLDGEDVTATNAAVRNQVARFSADVHDGKIKGSTGKAFRDLVVIGIGGSYLGAQFVAEALKGYADKGITLHFLANVDPDNFGEIAAAIDPEATLWIIISKSYTTAETLANTVLAYDFMKARGLDPGKHVVTVTAKGSPGDDPANPVVATFHMFDYIGGRFSVTSAVGGVPLSLYLGVERFEAFLKGAEEMDRHTLTAEPQKNLPLLSALLSIWNANFLGYAAQGIIPYATALQKLAPHVQQLNMESNGKAVTLEGQPLDATTGPIIFGEPGTNAQHSFFQLAHQGRPFPIEFLGVIEPQTKALKSLSKGVTNHQELWANLLAQPMALALGKKDKDPAKSFTGNRPSSTLILPDLSPQSVGKLLAFYEHRTVLEAFVWGINPFDQFGVELGKTLASGIRSLMAKNNQDPLSGFGQADPITHFYLEMLFRGQAEK